MTRLLGLIAGMFVFVLMLPHVAWACEHCFGAAVDSATTRGIAFAMAALLGFTGVVATGVLSFFRKVSVRARELEAGDLAVTEYGYLVDRNDAADSN